MDGVCKMNVQSMLLEIEESASYKEWKKEYPQHSFLVSIFSIVEDEKPIKWNFNFFTPGTEKATTFVTFPEISRQGESELISDDPKAVDIENVTMTFPEIVESASDAFSENYAKMNYSKMMATLHQEEGKPVWNISFLTDQGKTITIRLGADDGKMISHKAYSISDFKNLKTD